MTTHLALPAPQQPIDKNEVGDEFKPAIIQDDDHLAYEHAQAMASQTALDKE